MNFYYWCPFLSEVATVKAVLNSAHSLTKYSKGIIKPYIINSVGEWTKFEKEIKEKKIDLINFHQDENFYRKLPRYTYLKSRYSYLLIILKSYTNLYKFLKTKNESDYFIIHLISSLPLIFLVFFNFRCKFILRISGFPKLNILRKILWKLAGKKLYKIFSPTQDTKEMLINKNIFNIKKINVLKDPIVDIKKINFLKKEKSSESTEIKNYIINVGRLTKQKNQIFLIEAFAEIKKKIKETKLVILGEGELKEELIKKAAELNISNDVHLLGYKENVYPFYKNAMCFVLTSKWEDPGFVMIEAAASRLTIISSNCNNGPKEFIKDDERGYLYENYSLKSFQETFDRFMQDSKTNNNNIEKKNLKAFKEAKHYTKFSHYNEIMKCIKN